MEFYLLLGILCYLIMKIYESEFVYTERFDVQNVLFEVEGMENSQYVHSSIYGNPRHLTECSVVRSIL